jgi:hypothetical protein
MYQSKRTALHYAAEGGHGKIVETLVEAKADPCAKEAVKLTDALQCSMFVVQ